MNRHSQQGKQTVYYLGIMLFLGVIQIIRDTQGGGGRQSVTETFFAFLNTVSNAFWS